MTGEQWNTCRHPREMLVFLRTSEMGSDRKFRLAASAYCRSVWQFMGKASRTAVILGEQMADGTVDESHRDAVVRAAIERVCRWEEAVGDYFMAADMAYRVPCNDGWYAAEWTIGNWIDVLPSGLSIIRDIFGNPFNPPAPVAPSLLTPRISTLALASYNERSLPGGTFDRTRLAALAAALEEAGCENAELVGHLRNDGPHVRGCYAVDAILGKS